MVLENLTSSSGSNDISEEINYGRENGRLEEPFPQLRSAIVQLLQAFEDVQLFGHQDWQWLMHCDSDQHQRPEHSVLFSRQQTEDLSSAFMTM